MYICHLFEPLGEEAIELVQVVEQPALQEQAATVRLGLATNGTI